jgi:hypothetical protein
MDMIVVDHTRGAPPSGGVLLPVQGISDYKKNCSQFAIKLRSGLRYPIPVGHHAEETPNHIL